MMPDMQKGDETPDAVQRLLARRGNEAGFLGDQHGEAARRLARLMRRAQLSQRVTMSYDASHVGGNRGRPVQGELADSAAEARRLLGALAQRLPGDCWSVLVDVCCFDRGLQDIELSHGWPRRGAKLVLRIALDQLASLWGLGGVAEGRAQGRQRHWLPERPPMFAD